MISTHNTTNYGQNVKIKTKKIIISFISCILKVYL